MRHVLLLLAILLPMLAVAATASSSLVFAQNACQVQAQTVYVQYYPSNGYGSTNSYTTQMRIPISLTCPYASRTLWATGTLSNPSTNSNLGSSNVTMNANGNYYSGLLRFNIPSGALGQPLQVSISVYNNGQGGSLVSSTTVPAVAAPYGGGYYGSYGYQNYGYYPYTGYYYGYPSSGSCSYQWYSGYGYGYPYYGCVYPYPGGYYYYP